jgi:hypothetical protein
MSKNACNAHMLPQAVRGIVFFVIASASLLSAQAGAATRHCQANYIWATTGGSVRGAFRKTGVRTQFLLILA